MGSNVIDRAFFELNSNAPDVEKGFAGLLRTMAGTNDAVIRAQQKFQELKNTQDSLLNTIKRLEEEHGRHSQILEAGTNDIRKWGEANDRVGQINKELAELDKKAAKSKEELAAATKKLEQATTQSGTSFQAFGQIVSNFITHPVKTAQDGIQTLLTAMGPTAVGIGAIGAAAVAAGVAIHKMAESEREYAQTIMNMSAQTGLSVGEMEALDRAGKELGLGAQNLGRIIGQLQQQMGDPEGGKFTSNMVALGISVRDAQGNLRPLMEILKDFADYLRSMSSEAERGQVANEVLSGRMRALIPFVNNATINFREYIDELERFPIKTEDAIKAQANHAVQMQEQLRGWERLKDAVADYAEQLEFVGRKRLGDIFEGNWMESFANMVNSVLPGTIVKLKPPAPAIPETSPYEFVGPKAPSFGNAIGLEAIRGRQEMIADLEAMIKGDAEDLDLKRQISREMEKWKQIQGSGTPEELQAQEKRVEGLNRELKARQDLRKEEADRAKELDKQYEAYIKDINERTMKGPEAIKKWEDAAIAAQEAFSKLDNKIEELNQKARESALIKFDESAAKKILNYASLTNDINKAATTSKLEELRYQEQIIGAVTPFNQAQREQIEIEKIHLQFVIQAEEIRLRFEQLRANLEEKINKADLTADQRAALRAKSIADLTEAENKALTEASNLEAAKVQQVHQQEYQRMIDTVRQGAGQVFDAISSRGQDAFQSLRDWLEGTWLTGLRTLFQNFIESIVTGFKGGLGGLLQGIVPGAGGGQGGGWGQSILNTTPKLLGEGGKGEALSTELGSNIPPQFQPGSVYQAGSGGTFAMDYYAALTGGSFVIPEVAPTKSSLWGNLLGKGGQGMNWGTFFGGGESGFFGSEGSPGFLGSGTGGINGKGVGGALGGMMMAGGASMFMDSLSRKGVGAWGEAIGGGAMTGFALGGPWGAAIGAGAGLVSRFVKLAMGKNAYEAGSMEAARDFGGISVSQDEFKSFLGTQGISESEAYPNRKNLLSSPDFLKDYAWAAAQAQGKTDEFLKSLENVQTSWGTFNFRPAFDIGRLTGDWTALNKVWKETAEMGSRMRGVGEDVAEGLLVGEEALKPWEQLIVDFNDLKKGIQESIPPVKSMYQTFLETGEITDELSQQITYLGGDLAAFQKVSDLTTLNNNFNDMVTHFRETGEILPELRQMFIDFGGDLKALDDAAELPALHTSLTMIQGLMSGLESLAPNLDPVKALLSGQWNPEVIAALTGAGLDPSKLAGLSPLINLEQNWSKMAVPFTKLTPELESALQKYGGAEGRYAVERYYQGVNTITEGLLATVKAAMDVDYQKQIKSALDYLGTMEEQTGDKITTLTTSVEKEFGIVSKNITDKIESAKNDLIDEIDLLIAAVANKGAAAVVPTTGNTEQTSGTGEQAGAGQYSSQAEWAAYESAHASWWEQYQQAMMYGMSEWFLQNNPEPQPPPYPPAPQAHTGGLIIEGQAGEAVLDRQQTQNLLRDGSQQRPLIQIINGTFWTFQDFVEQVRQAGLDLQRRHDPQWT